MHGAWERKSRHRLTVERVEIEMYESPFPPFLLFWGDHLLEITLGRHAVWMEFPDGVCQTNALLE